MKPLQFLLFLSIQALVAGNGCKKNTNITITINTTGDVVVGINNCTSSAQFFGCYYNSQWASQREGNATFLPENYVPGLCTNFLYAFAGLDDGNNAM